MKYLLVYLIIVSVLAVVITIYDKVHAVRHKYRVSEFALMLISAIGGSVVMLLTMLIISHKTRHIKFMLGIPLIILIQCAIIFLIWRLNYV